MLNAVRLALSGATTARPGYASPLTLEAPFPSAKYFRDTAWRKNAELLAEVLDISVMDQLTVAFDSAARVFGEATEQKKPFEEIRFEPLFTQLAGELLMAMPEAVQKLQSESEKGKLLTLIKQLRTQQRALAQEHRIIRAKKPTD
jgi:hypothetical protein